MRAVRRYRFPAVVTFDPAPRRGAAGRTSAYYLVEPYYRVYFPAVIAPDEAMVPPRPAVGAVVSIALDGEDVAFFGLGQRFTIWADAIVGRAVLARGRVGSGVIASPVWPPLPDPDHDGTARVAGRPCRHRVAPGVPAASGPGPGRGRRPVV